MNRSIRPSPGRRTVLAAIGGLLTARASAQAGADPYPSRPIRFIQPFSAGSGPDVTTRMLVKAMGDRLGANVVVENKVGAVGLIGVRELAKADPDGYTIGYVNNAIAVSQWLLGKGSVDIARELAPISALTYQSNILVVASSFPATGTRELVEMIRRRPGEYSFASGGNGTPAHLNGDLFRRANKLEVVHVPYKALAPAINDLSRGDVHYMFGIATSVMPAIRAGKLRAIAVAAPRRMALLPDVPTMEETGFKGLDVRSWGGIVAPARTPAPIVARLRQAMAQVLSDPEIIRALQAQGSDVAEPDADFATLLRTESARWKQYVEETGLKAD